MRVIKEKISFIQIDRLDKLKFSNGISWTIINPNFSQISRPSDIAYELSHARKRQGNGAIDNSRTAGDYLENPGLEPLPMQAGDCRLLPQVPNGIPVNNRQQSSWAEPSSFEARDRFARVPKKANADEHTWLIATPQCRPMW